MKIEGGHAYMLSVELPQTLDAARRAWINENMSRTLPKLHEHITIKFVGRDLDVSVGHAMIENAKRIIHLVPKTVKLNGVLAMFGALNDHLVALVDKTPLIGLWNGLDAKGSWNPHVTLAIGQPGDKRPQAFGIYELSVKSLDVKIGGTVICLDPSMREEDF